MSVCPPCRYPDVEPCPCDESVQVAGELAFPTRPSPDVLTPRQREAFDLRETGLLYKQIGYKLGINESAAHRLVMWARERLGLPRTMRETRDRWAKEA